MMPSIESEITGPRGIAANSKKTLKEGIPGLTLYREIIKVISKHSGTCAKDV
jgi:hypothetical protein